MSVYHNQKENTHARYSEAFASLLHQGKKISNYKFVLMIALLREIHKRSSPYQSTDKDRVRHVQGKVLVPMSSLARRFFQLQHILYHRYRMKIIRSDLWKGAIVSIVEGSPGTDGLHSIARKDISNDITDQVLDLLHRNVLYALRNDCPIYDFYNTHAHLISSQAHIANENEFKRVVKRNELGYLGVDEDFVAFVDYVYPTLLYAIVGALTEFLEGLNNTPRIFLKIMGAIEASEV